MDQGNATRPRVFARLSRAWQRFVRRIQPRPPALAPAASVSMLDRRISNIIDASTSGIRAEVLVAATDASESLVDRRLYDLVGRSKVTASGPPEDRRFWPKI